MIIRKGYINRTIQLTTLDSAMGGNGRPEAFRFRSPGGRHKYIFKHL